MNVSRLPVLRALHNLTVGENGARIRVMSMSDNRVLAMIASEACASRSNLISRYKCLEMISGILQIPVDWENLPSEDWVTYAKSVPSMSIRKDLTIAEVAQMESLEGLMEIMPKSNQERTERFT